jgi:hypothetical protein
MMLFPTKELRLNLKDLEEAISKCSNMPISEMISNRKPFIAVHHTALNLANKANEIAHDASKWIDSPTLPPIRLVPPENEE